MLEFSFLVDIIGKFTQPRSFTYHGDLNKPECEQYCNGALPLTSKSILNQAIANIVSADIPFIMELQDFKDLEDYSIHIRGGYNHETRTWSWDDQVIDDDYWFRQEGVSF